MCAQVKCILYLEKLILDGETIGGRVGVEAEEFINETEMNKVLNYFPGTHARTNDDSPAARHVTPRIR